MSITSNFPAIKPTLLLDFANTKQLDPRITFTRASTATYYGTQTAKAEENLVLQSQTLNSASWTTTNATLASDTTTAPDGTTTAETLTDETVAQAHVCSQVVTTTAGLVYTLSFFLKASTKNFAVVTLSSATIQNYITAVADLSTGAITETSTGTSATFTSSSIASVGSGWYRVVITGSCTTGFTRAEIGLASAATGNSFATNGRVTYTGTGTSIFAWGAQLEQRSAVTAYTVTTTQAITNYIPQLLTAASGVARFDNNPTTFESLGLLIEESRTNLLTYSEQFDNAAWTKTRASITANTIVAPDGTLTGDKLVDTTDASTTHLISQSASFVSGTTYTTTLYAKKGEIRYVRLGFGATAFGAIQVGFFDLQDGVVTTTSGTVTTSMTSVGNGWWRIRVTATATATTSDAVQINLTLNGTSSNFTGDGYSGIYIWGAQLEAGAFATSYIPTVASQVTRAAEVASMTGTNFSSWYNAGQGTLYAEANTPSFATNYVFADINNNSISTYIRQSTASTGTTTQLAISDNAVLVAAPGVSVTLGSYRKMAGAYAVDSVQQSVNGFLGTEDTSSIIPSGLVQMNIGTRSSGASPVNGTIKKIAYYPLRVTNAQLQGLTS